MVGDTPVYGRKSDVTLADIRAAIAADYLPNAHPSSIRVANKDEINLYYGSPDIDTGHHVIRRINGKWRYYTETIVTD
jgi:hypothetical protein